MGHNLTGIEMAKVKRSDETGFSERLEFAMREGGYSQAELARELGVSKGNVAHWLKGRTESPAATVLLEIGRVLDVNLEWLVRNTGQMRPATSSRPINPRLLSEAILALDSVLESEGIDLSAERRADVIVHLYGLSVTNKSDEAPDAGVILSLVKLL